ncbi:chaperonin 10-like protein [Jimgerdemannia flammicorona]|uniref:Chaperonin 10-like protein n=1 Tax=Jimgerdemannia flammicorona TaxID=994334 RepID=A0A433QWV2_9FUNG|nr:chaperonin 10-like protein [Jimgerdemannia flammicorona]
MLDPMAARLEMKAYVVERWLKGPEELVLRKDAPVPTPAQLKKGEIIVDVKAIGLNFFDILMVCRKGKFKENNGCGCEVGGIRGGCLICLILVIRHASLLEQIQGKYQIKPPFPFIPGGEFSGVVVATHPSVKNCKPGDRVFGNGFSYAERIVVKSGAILPVPQNFSFEEAAGLFITYPTSYAALVLRAQLKKGAFSLSLSFGSWLDEVCLVHAAAGGVGIAAVQIAKVPIPLCNSSFPLAHCNHLTSCSPLLYPYPAQALGATVIATAGSADKLEVARRNGADHCINYRDKDWTQQVKNLTNGHGADVVYDPVGLIDESMKCTAWNGRILVVGFGLYLHFSTSDPMSPQFLLLLSPLSSINSHAHLLIAKGTFEKVAMNRVLLKNISLVGVHWGAYVPNEPERIPEVWDGLFRMFANGTFRPVVYERVYDIAEIPEALDAIGTRKTYGKVVARVEDGKSKL